MCRSLNNVLEERYLALALAVPWAQASVILQFDISPHAVSRNNGFNVKTVDDGVNLLGILSVIIFFLVDQHTL